MAQTDEISRRLVDAGLSARSALAGPLLTDFVLIGLDAPLRKVFDPRRRPRGRGEIGDRPNSSGDRR